DDEEEDRGGAHAPVPSRRRASAERRRGRASPRGGVHAVDSAAGRGVHDVGGGGTKGGADGAAAAWHGRCSGRQACATAISSSTSSTSPWRSPSSSPSIIR